MKHFLFLKIGILSHSLTDMNVKLCFEVFPKMNINFPNQLFDYKHRFEQSKGRERSFTNYVLCHGIVWW
jgi:hypothetical protein